jgi:hypothetical protein
MIKNVLYFTSVKTSVPRSVVPFLSRGPLYVDKKLLRNTQDKNNHDLINCIFFKCIFCYKLPIELFYHWSLNKHAVM